MSIRLSRSSSMKIVNQMKQNSSTAFQKAILHSWWNKGPAHYLIGMSNRASPATEEKGRSESIYKMKRRRQCKHLLDLFLDTWKGEKEEDRAAATQISQKLISQKPTLSYKKRTNPFRDNKTVQKRRKIAAKRLCWVFAGSSKHSIQALRSWWDQRFRCDQFRGGGKRGDQLERSNVNNGICFKWKFGAMYRLNIQLEIRVFWTTQSVVLWLCSRLTTRKDCWTRRW